MSEQIRPVHSISGFCKAHDISTPTFYRLKKAGQAPKMYYIGRRGFITEEAAAQWRRDMEAASA